MNLTPPAVTASAASVAAITPGIQAASPTVGQTVTMTDDAVDGTLYLTPAGTLLTLTVALPSNAASRVGQIRRIVTSQVLTGLTVTAASASILGAPTTLALGGYVSFQKMASGQWARIA